MRKHPFQTTLLCFFLLLGISLTGRAQGTLYLVTCIDAVNADIAGGCKQDAELAVDLFRGEAARLAGLNFSQIDLPFSQAAVQDFVDKFQCNSNDVVIFLYSGHGFRYDDDGDEWPWPYMYLCDRNSDKETLDCDFDLEQVYDALVEKGPRMSITIGNSCNDPLENSDPDSDATPYVEDASQRQRFFRADLFSQFSGHIIASACSRNQSAYTNIDAGSYFAVELFKSIAAALDSDKPRSWEGIFNKTKTAVNTLTDGRQTPQFRVRY